jgi:hypothetical protein
MEKEIYFTNLKKISYDINRMVMGTDRWYYTLSRY